MRLDTLANFESKINAINIEWDNYKSLCVVLCSKGYPKKYINEIEIKNLEKFDLSENQFIFHAGTKKENNKIISNGGRVLNFVTKSQNFKVSRDQALNLIKKLNWSNGYYRKDIGYKVINK